MQNQRNQTKTSNEQVTNNQETQTKTSFWTRDQITFTLGIITTTAAVILYFNSLIKTETETKVKEAITNINIPKEIENTVVMLNQQKKLLRGEKGEKGDTPQIPGFQTGAIEIDNKKGWDKDGETKKITETIVFNPSFEEKPTVMVSLRHIDVLNDKPLRIGANVNVKKCESKSCEIIIYTWADSEVKGVIVDWLAFGKVKEKL